MRKIVAILLLALFLFNLAGYRIWFYYARQQANQQFEAALDNARYNEQDLFTVTIPLSMPYQVEQADFERVNGEINVNGKIYKYVKRKVSNGMLILQCLADERSTHIQKASDAYLQFASDISATQDHAKKNGHPVTSVFKNLFSDYMPANYTAGTPPAQFIHSMAALAAISSLADAKKDLPEQPPESASLS